MNFVLIKFSLNALLFEKSWDESKNPSFLHKAVGIESDTGSMKMQRCLSTFIALTLGSFGNPNKYKNPYLTKRIFMKYSLFKKI